MLFSSLVLIKLNLLKWFFCVWCLRNIFCNQISYMFFTCSICVSLREVIYWSVEVFIWYFLHKVSKYFWIGIGVYFWSKGSPRRSFGSFDGMSSFGSLLFRFVSIFSWRGLFLNFLGLVCFISDIRFFILHTLFNQLNSVVVYSPSGLFHFLHIFYILEVWYIFLYDAQIFGSYDIWVELECIFWF